jgi:hypothetical protein
MRLSYSMVPLVAALVAPAGALPATDPLAAEDQFSADVEREMMASFDASAENKVPPERGELVSGIDLVGEWSTPAGYASTRMKFVANQSGGYTVHFEAAGCLGSWGLHRNAAYAGHTVTLDLPVQEYLPATYTLLHTIRYRGKEYLLPSAHVADFDGELGSKVRIFDMVLLSRVSEGRD